MSVSFTDGSEACSSSCEDNGNSSCKSKMQEEDGLDLDQIVPNSNYHFYNYREEYFQEKVSWERCKTHGKKLKFFCLEHNAYICSYCYMVGECNHHQFKFVIDFKLQFKEKTREFRRKELSLLIQEKKESLRKLLKAFPVPKKKDADLKIFELFMELEFLFWKEFKKLDESLAKKPHQALLYKLSEYGNYIKADNPSDIINQDNVALEKGIEEAVLSYKEEINTILNELSQSLEQVLEKINSEPNVDDCPTLFKQIRLIRKQDIEEIQKIEMEIEKEKEKEKAKDEDEEENRLSTSKNKENILPHYRFVTEKNLQVEKNLLVVTQQKQKGKEILNSLDKFCNVDTLAFRCQDLSFSDSDLRVFRYFQKKLGLKKFHFKPESGTAGFEKIMSSFPFNPLDVEEIHYDMDAMFRREYSKLIEEELFKFSAQILPQMVNLISFNFDLMDSGIDDEFIFLFVQDVLPNLKNLKVFNLNISETQVGEDSILALVQNLPPLKNLHLYLSDLKISDREVNALAESLKGFNNLENLKLEFDSEKITDLSVQVLFDNLPETVKSIKLDFGCDAEITAGCLNNFFKFKLPRLQQLENLKMSGVDEVINKKASKWKQYLEKRKREIEESD